MNADERRCFAKPSLTFESEPGISSKRSVKYLRSSAFIGVSIA